MCKAFRYSNCRRSFLLYRRSQQALSIRLGGPDEASLSRPLCRTTGRCGGWQEACFDEDELGDQGKSDCQRFRDAAARIGCRR